MSSSDTTKRSLMHDYPPGQEFSFMTESTKKKKKAGRSRSPIWRLLTDDPDPNKSNSATCKHCHQIVYYYKKSEQAIRHLKRCTPFQVAQRQPAFMAEYKDSLPFYHMKIAQESSNKTGKVQERSNAGLSTASSPPSIPSPDVSTSFTLDAPHPSGAIGHLSLHHGLSDHLMDPITTFHNGIKDEPASKRRRTESTSARTTTFLQSVSYDRAEEDLAMHIYTSGASLDMYSKPYLQRALSVLLPSSRVPDRKRLENELLQRCYDKVQMQVCSYLMTQSAICLKRDDWSHCRMGTESKDGEGSPCVMYTALCSDKYFLLDAVQPSAHTCHDAHTIATDIRAMMTRVNYNVSGVVTAANEAYVDAWELLKTDFPTKFFYGCSSHALQLAMHDLLRTDMNRHDDDALCDLVEFVSDADKFLSLFTTLPLSKHFDRKAVQIMMTATCRTKKYVDLGRRLEFLAKNRQHFSSVVSKKTFVTAMGRTDQKVRQWAKDFMLSLNSSMTLDKGIEVASVFEKLQRKFMEDQTTLSDIYFELKHLSIAFDDLFSLSDTEIQKLKDIVIDRLMTVVGDAHRLAFVLDPRYVDTAKNERELMEEYISEHAPSESTVDVEEEQKNAIGEEYEEYVVFATQDDRNEGEGREMDKRDMFPLEFWHTIGQDWPRLKALALTLFSLTPTSITPDKMLHPISVPSSTRRNKVRGDVQRKIGFICVNEAQLCASRSSDLQLQLPELSMHEDSDLSPDDMMEWDTLALH